MLDDCRLVLRPQYRQALNQIGDRPAAHLRAEERLEDARRGIGQSRLELVKPFTQLLGKPPALLRVHASRAAAAPCGSSASLLLELAGHLGVRRRLAALETLRMGLLDDGGLGRRHGLPVRGLSQRCPRVVTGIELEQIAGDRRRAHALSAPRIHCLRMAAACSSS